MIRKVALITGGAKRIGGAISNALATAGYAVVIHARERAEAEARAASLRSLGHRAAAVSADLADLAGLANLMVAAAKPFGQPDLLVNNASLFENDDFATLDPARFSAHLAVNLQAPVLLAQAFAARLPLGEAGSIINLIDQRVLRPNPQFFSYSLAKSALYTATKTMAQALAKRGIRVNGIGPGPVLPNKTDGSEGFAHEVAGTPLGKAVPLEEIARTVLFLAQADTITGQMIAVDSGQHLGWQTPDIVT